MVDWNDLAADSLKDWPECGRNANTHVQHEMVIDPGSRILYRQDLGLVRFTRLADPAIIAGVRGQ